MLSILENKAIASAAPAVSPVVPESPDLATLRARLEDLLETERLLAAQLQGGEERVAHCRGALDAMQTKALTSDNPLESIQESQERLNEAIAATTPVAQRLSQCRLLIERARREITAAEGTARENYRRSLEDRHRAAAVKMAESLGAFMNASLEMETLHHEAFETYPPRSTTNAPAVFFSNLRAFVRTGPQRPAWDFLNDFVRFYGIEDLPPAASEYLLRWPQFRLENREQEAQRLKNVRLELDSITKGHERLQEEARHNFYGTRFEQLRAAGTI